MFGGLRRLIVRSKKTLGTLRGAKSVDTRTKRPLNGNNTKNSKKIKTKNNNNMINLITQNTIPSTNRRIVVANATYDVHSLATLIHVAKHGPINNLGRSEPKIPHTRQIMTKSLQNNIMTRAINTEWTPPTFEVKPENRRVTADQRRTGFMLFKKQLQRRTNKMVRDADALHGVFLESPKTLQEYIKIYEKTTYRQIMTLHDIIRELKLVVDNMGLEHNAQYHNTIQDMVQKIENEISYHKTYFTFMREHWHEQSSSTAQRWNALR